MTGITAIQQKWKQDRQQARDRRADIERRIAQLQGQRDGIVMPIANDLLAAIGDLVTSEDTGLTYDVLGPFGLGREIALHFSRNGETVSSLTFRPDVENDHYGIVDYRSSSGKYPAGSLGERNGLNHSVRPIPDDLREIMGMLRDQEQERTPS